MLGLYLNRGRLSDMRANEVADGVFIAIARLFKGE